MPRYRYQALTAEGISLDGALDAATEREAARTLERRGLAVVSIEPEGAQGIGKPKARQRRLKSRDIILALQELATLLDAGVALAEAVSAQARSQEHPRLAGAFDSIATGLRRGQAFSQALQAANLPLPAYVLTLVESGEKAGLLARSLADAAAQMDYDRTVRDEMRHSLTYPTILVVAGLAAIVMMFTFVVPRFASLMARAQDLPWLAAAVLGTGMFLRAHLVPLLLALGLAVAAAVWYLRAPARRAEWMDWLERAPVIGAWRVEAETAAWARVLSTLLGNRVPLMDALSLAQSGLRSPRRRAHLEEVARAVRGGSPLADALEQQGALTPTGYNLVRVGERAGELPAMLRSLARLYEDAGRSRMKQFLALLEPLAILVIGSIIGVVMIGIILAITSANDIAL